MTCSVKPFCVPAEVVKSVITNGTPLILVSAGKTGTVVKMQCPVGNGATNMVVPRLLMDITVTAAELSQEQEAL